MRGRGGGESDEGGNERRWREGGREGGCGREKEEEAAEAELNGH